MKLKMIVLLMAAGLTGCAVSPENKQAWETKSVIDVRHGMAESMAFYQIGRTRQAQGHLAGAEAAYEKALATDPQNLDAMNALGALYAERGELERSAAIYKRVAARSPQRAYLYNNIGYSLHLQGRHAEAVDALRQAVTLDPGYERAWVNLQNVARKAGMLELAELAVRHSLPSAAGQQTALAKAGEPEEAVAVNGGDRQEIALQVSEGVRDAGVPPTLPVDEKLVSRQTVAKAVAVPEMPAPVASATVVASRSQQGVIRMTDAPASVLLNDGSGKAGDRLALNGGFGQPQPPVKAMKVSMHGFSQPSVVNPLPSARIEVSNGNGVTGYASRIRAQLKSDGMGVSRMTNFTSFNVRRTVIEYRGGFAESAQLLRDRLGTQALLRETRLDRPGTDVRVILGLDLVAPARVLSEAEPDGFSPLV